MIFKKVYLGGCSVGYLHFLSYPRDTIMPTADDLHAQKSIVIHFLKRCNGYAETNIQAYKQQNSDACKKWESYLEFNLYAIRELETTTLDHWFDETSLCVKKITSSRPVS